MKKSLLVLLLTLSFLKIFAQKYTISGYVEDLQTGEKLISAYVFDEVSKKGTVTNTYGFYSITLPKDSVKLVCSYLGYSPLVKIVYLKKNIKLDFKLSLTNELQEIEITGERVEKIEEKSQMSQVDVPVKQIKSLPALFGEVDVLKTLQLLPGVQAGTEGTSGLYVRGGSPDQNLVLLDNVPVYNVSHFLGIFSVFNADALKNVSITKGGFPARYGGRLSSIIDINMKDGNMKEYHGNGSIGNITSKLMIEGPVIKDKASFIVSGRRTYADFFLRPLIKRAASAEGESFDLKLYFYDLNAKANYIINDKNRLYLSFYSGNDVFGFENKEKYKKNISENAGGINWGNTILALKWNNQINPKLFLNSTVTYSNFTTLFKAEYSDTDLENNKKSGFYAKYSSGIKDYAAKMDFDYLPLPNHYIKFGAGFINHTYNPGVLNLKAENNSFILDTLLGYNKSQSQEFDVYFEDDIKYGNLKANVGLHFSAFKTGKKFYNSLQPRIGLRYLLGNGIALKGSFAKMKQYINLLTSESISTPLDLWVPSTDQIKPQYSRQEALGIAKTFANDIEFSLEGYYKKMENVISYRPGSSFLGEVPGEIAWESKVVQGDGQSYGIELLLQKKRGEFSGWIAYTLSWNWRQFDEINGGEKYPFKYDKRHDFAVVGTYNISKNIVFSASWIYSTGNAVSIPVFKYPYKITNSVSGKPNIYYEIESLGKKNSFRMSDSHRLDISVEFHKKKKKWERAWVIGIYNTYNHKNPFFMISDYDYNREKIVYKEVSLLPVLPFISYQFKF